MRSPREGQEAGRRNVRGAARDANRNGGKAVGFIAVKIVPRVESVVERDIPFLDHYLALALVFFLCVLFHL